jgi:hypothetical protein
LEFVAYLFAFYLMDGVVRGAVHGSLFVSPFGGRWRRLAGTAVWVHFWPGARAVRVSTLPVEITRKGVHFPEPWPSWRSGAHPPSAHFLAFDAMEGVRSDGASVLAGRVRIARCASSAVAKAVASHVERLRTTNAARRPEAIAAFLDASLDRAAFESAHAEVERRVAWLSALCTSQYLLLFGLTPIAIAFLPSARAFVALGCMLVVQHALIVALFVRARGALAPDAKGRAGRAVGLALYPPSALQAPLELVRDRFAEFHPLAVGAALLPPKEFADFARALLDRTGHPNWENPHLAGDAVDPDRWEAARSHRTAILTFLGNPGFPPCAADERKPRVDPAAETYCPVCLAEYAGSPPACSQCAVPVRAFGVEVLSAE